MKVTEKLYNDSEYRKQLLLRVLPKFDKLEQFDKLHEEIEDKQEEGLISVSKGAANLMR